MIINLTYLALSGFVFYWFYKNIKKYGPKWIVKGLLQLGILDHAVHCAASGISHLTKSPRAACQTFCHKPASGVAKNGDESVVGDGCALRWGALRTSRTRGGRSDSSILNKLLYVFTSNLMM